MRRDHRRFGLVLLSIVVSMTAITAQQRQVPGAIRSRVTLVPIDVRVVNSDGEPITDLSQADFTILEDGVPQRIGHFSTQAFEPQLSIAQSTAPLLRRGPGLDPTPATRRTFLIVLGRGRIQYPARGIDALRDFIRHRALPQDLIAVQAYGRITDFTTAREPLLALLDKYEQQHERLEALLDHWFQGPWMWDVEASPGIERQVAAFFEQPGMPTVRRVSIPDLEEEIGFETARREARDAWMWTRTGHRSERDFVYEPAGRDDAEKVFGAIEFLRYFEGEKHVIYLSEEGLVGGLGVDADVMASRAADARVTLTLVRTGGVQTSWRGGVFTGPPPATFFANADARHIAAETGGVASAYSYASETLNRLDRVTRFNYVIGYYPAKTEWNGERRRIEVRVNKPGLTVLHRGSYYDREDLVPFDRRAFVTHSRITGASQYRVLLKDIAISLNGSVVKSRRDDWRALATVTIDPATIAFDRVDGRHVASLDIAIFAGGRGQRVAGELRRRLDLKLEAASYARAAKEGVTFEVALEAREKPRYLKAVVYDYAADKLGSAVVEIR